jgi:plasmid stabilization system protein ParE
MALQIKWTENALEDYRLVVEYLLKEWSVDIAAKFVDIVEKRLDTLSAFPLIGIKSEKEDTVRSVVITKHNKLYYQVSDKSIVILNIFDTRQHPQKNKYGK